MVLFGFKVIVNILFYFQIKEVQKFIMLRLQGDYTDLIRFIPAGREESTKKSKEITNHLTSNLSGKDAKEFYESLFVDEKVEISKCTDNNYYRQKKKRKLTVDSSCSKQKIKRKISQESNSNYDDICLKQNSSKKQNNLEQRFNKNEFLKCAQCGKLKQMKILIERGIPVDVCDSYGWTAIMCAAYEGHYDIVDCLLEHGANVNICNGQNKTAYSLASEKGHKSVLKVIDKHRKLQSTEPQDNQFSDISNIFFCKVCKSEFNNCTKKEHETSTIHLFNLNLKPKPDQFLLPSTNVGYQMMKKKGWDGEKGLGVSGQGQKYPVKTVLKHDRKCLGNDTCKTNKPRITHFGPGDTNSVKSKPKKQTERKLSARTLSKKAKLVHDRQMKQWEQNFRMYFNSE